MLDDLAKLIFAILFGPILILRAARKPRNEK